MAWYGFGTPTLTSTQGQLTDPSTSALLAELSSLTHDNYEMRVSIGASTSGIFFVEHKTSTAVPGTLRENPNTGYLGRRVLYGVTNQTAQYVFRFKAEVGDSVCVRLPTTLGAGSIAAATIQLEKLDG